MGRTALLLFTLVTWLLAGCAPLGRATVVPEPVGPTGPVIVSYVEPGERVELHMTDDAQLTGVVSASDATSVHISTEGRDLSVPMERIQTMRVYESTAYKRNETRKRDHDHGGWVIFGALAGVALCSLLVYGVTQIPWSNFSKMGFAGGPD